MRRASPIHPMWCGCGCANPNSPPRAPIIRALAAGIAAGAVLFISTLARRSQAHHFKGKYRG